MTKDAVILVLAAGVASAVAFAGFVVFLAMGGMDEAPDDRDNDMGWTERDGE